MKKKILVDGCNGMLGSAIEKVFKDFIVIPTDIDEYDVRNPLNTPKVDYILHLAALTDLEYCQNYPRNAYYTNTIGTINMMEEAKKQDIPIVYMSTAGVFGNTGASYFDEDSKPDPVNTYGRSKYYGELAIKGYPKHWIFRISWAFGGGARDRKFVMMMYKEILKQPKVIRSVQDTCGSPSYTVDVARVIKDTIVKNKPYGIYHIPCGEASRWQVVQEMIDYINMPWIKNEGVPESYFGQYTAIRPKCEVLKSVKGVQVRDWKEALREYIDELLEEKK